MSAAPRSRLVVLISGGGSNLQAFIDASADPAYPCEVVAVISNRAGVFGLERAARAGIPAEVLDHTAFPTREAFDVALADRIDAHRPDLVILAGFMRILTPGFVRRYAGRLLNIHPSLLPKYPGLHTHQRAPVRFWRLARSWSKVGVPAGWRWKRERSCCSNSSRWPIPAAGHP